MFVEKRNDLLETSVAQIGQRQAPDRAGLVGLTLVIRNGSAELGLEKHLQMEASLGLELRPVFFEPSITKHVDHRIGQHGLIHQLDGSVGVARLDLRGKMIRLDRDLRSEENTSEIQSLMRISY